MVEPKDNEVVAPTDPVLRVLQGTDEPVQPSALPESLTPLLILRFYLYFLFVLYFLAANPNAPLVQLHWLLTTLSLLDTLPTRLTTYKSVPRRVVFSTPPHTHTGIEFLSALHLPFLAHDCCTHIRSSH